MTLFEENNESLFEESSKKTRQTIIKCETLSKVLREINIPYEITSEKTKSKNWWKVNNVEITTDDE